MLIDTHCHLYSEYYSDIDDIVNLAKKSNVNILINNGCDSKSNKEVIDLLDKYKNMYGAIGIHPEEVENYSLDDIKFIEDNLNNKKVVAIGEIGLDYHYSKENKEKQIKLFELQLDMANKYNIPVIIHSRDATEDTINILKKYNIKGVIHSFSGSLETAKIYIKMGFLLGINGVVTFKNCNLKDILVNIGLNNIILETDSPYLTPVPYRGKQNNPSHILDIAKYISEIFNVSLEEVSIITTKNVLDLYNKITID